MGGGCSIASCVPLAPCRKTSSLKPSASKTRSLGPSHQYSLSTHDKLKGTHTWLFHPIFSRNFGLDTGRARFSSFHSRLSMILSNKCRVRHRAKRS